jgi:hypothetical protein
MDFSNYLENYLLTYLMASKTVYVGFSTAAPGEDGSGLAEPSGDGYAREAYGDYTVTGSEVTNDADIVFDTATASWGTLTYVCIFDALSGGNLLGSVSLSSLSLPDIPVIAGTQITIVAGDGVITLD